VQIADVYAALTLDTSSVDDTLQKDLPAKADAAGEQAGQTFGSKFGNVAKGLIGAGVGAAAGALFSTAAQGAAELNTAMAEFGATTGATQEEIASAQSAATDLYKTNLQSFEEIGSTLSVLRTDLGLTQDEANQTAGAFLSFATATKQDASQAVLAFDDILDAWGLTAQDSTGIMDLLVASHQKFGGSIEANQGALAALAPSMTALGLTAEDAVGYLNMFAASGVDSGAAVTGLTKALGKVKSPEELQKLIDQISATEDPFLRAQMASDLFGAKAGPKLALALSQGGLDQFMLSLDDVAGASDRAASAIEGSFGNQATMVLKQFSGTLAEVGSNFGPLLLGFSSLLPMAGPIFTAAGSALGGLLAAAIPIGMALWPVLLAGAIAAGIAILIANPGILTAITDFASGLITNLVSFLSGLPDALLGVLQGAFDFLVANGPTIIAGVVEFILSIPGKITELQVNFLTLFKDVFLAVVAALPGIVQGVIDFIVNLPDRLQELTTTMGLLFIRIGAAVREKVVAWLGEVADTLLSLPEKAADLLGGLVKLATDVGEGFRDKVGEFVQDVIDLVVGIPGEVMKFIAKFTDLGIALAKAIANGLIGIINGVIKAIIGAINSIQIHIPPITIDLGPLGTFSFAGFDWNGMGLVAPEIPSFALGTDFVPQDMLAVIHRGEAIVPADENAANPYSGASRAIVDVGGITIMAQTYEGSEADAQRHARDLFDRLQEEADRRGISLGRPVGAGGYA